MSRGKRGWEGTKIGKETGWKALRRNEGNIDKNVCQEKIINKKYEGQDEHET